MGNDLDRQVNRLIKDLGSRGATVVDAHGRSWMQPVMARMLEPAAYQQHP